jgi:hypothetical protein
MSKKKKSKATITYTIKRNEHNLYLKNNNIKYVTENKEDAYLFLAELKKIGTRFFKPFKDYEVCFSVTFS